ncbi:amidase family protein [Streptosporangium vulgare]|uniref:Amidase family protein n=1 Tax=Streptosporangium vulgare TaxID=46190 RepID=A0ABV5TEB8_9ACTN
MIAASSDDPAEARPSPKDVLPAGPMTRSVYDAATLLTALTGIDPQDPATAAGKDVVGTDYTAALSKDALRNVRIGVVGAPTGNQGVAFTRAVDVLRAQGATVSAVTVDTSGLPASILNYEFKRDLNAYLARLGRRAPMKTPDDVVRFNLAHAGERAIKFGQTLLKTSNVINLDDPATKATTRPTATTASPWPVSASTRRCGPVVSTRSCSRATARRASARGRGIPRSPCPSGTTRRTGARSA